MPESKKEKATNKRRQAIADAKIRKAQRERKAAMVAPKIRTK